MSNEATLNTCVTSPQHSHPASSGAGRVAASEVDMDWGDASGGPGKLSHGQFALVVCYLRKEAVRTVSISGTSCRDKILNLYRITRDLTELGLAVASYERKLKIAQEINAVSLLIQSMVYRRKKTKARNSKAARSTTSALSKKATACTDALPEIWKTALEQPFVFRDDALTSLAVEVTSILLAVTKGELQ